MSNQNQHLRRRGAVYHYRRRLPAPLKEILNETYFDGSLATADPARARKFARRISVALDQLSEHLQSMPAALKPTPGQLNLVLKELFYAVIRDGERRRELIGEGFNWLPAGNREAIMKDEADEETWQTYQDYRRRGIFDEELPERKAEFWRAWAADNVLDHIDPLLQDALAAANVELDLKDPSAFRLRQDALRLAAAAYQIDLDRWNGEFGHGQSAPEWIDDKYPMPTAILRTWSGRLSPDEVNFLSLPLEMVAENFIEKIVSHARARKTKRDWGMAIDYFCALIGNKPVGDISEKDVDNFREWLLDVPREFGKGIYQKKPKRRSGASIEAGFVDPKRAERFENRMTAKEAVKVKEEIKEKLKAAELAGQGTVRFEGYEWSLEQTKRKIATMTRKTANKHLSFFTKMWTSRAVPQSLRPMSPFSGALYPKSDVRNDEVRSARAEYTTGELKDIFTSAVWTGCESSTRRSTPGRLIIPDARFWVPLIAIFTGMRREEICQLWGNDFDTYGGIYYVKVQATEGRSLKTLAAAREIPIHDELMRIGLREFVEYRKPGWLFPELKRSKVDEVLGDNLGKWFYRYRRKIGLKSEATDFHSFRKTFTQHLRRAGEPLDHIKPITGHQENDITLRHYAPAFSLEQKKEVIQKFDLGVSFPQLYGRMPELLANLEAPLKRKARRRREPGGSPLGEAAAAE